MLLLFRVFSATYLKLHILAKLSEFTSIHALTSLIYTSYKFAALQLFNSFIFTLFIIFKPKHIIIQLLTSTAFPYNF